MAGNDAFLFIVPSDTDNDDVRLRNPNILAVVLTLAATEAADTFAGILIQGGTLFLAATEAADVAALGVQEGYQLAATEAADVALFSVAGGIRLEAVEASDTFAGVLSEGSTLFLSATEAADVALFSVQGGMALAAIEAPDTFAGAFVESTNIDLAASETPDVVLFSVQEGFRLAATEAPDVAVVEAIHVQFATTYGSSGWGDGGPRGATAIYGQANRAQKRQLKRLIEEAKDEDLPTPVIDEAKAAKTKDEISEATMMLRAELAKAADDDEDEDILLMAA